MRLSVISHAVVDPYLTVFDESFQEEPPVTFAEAFAGVSPWAGNVFALRARMVAAVDAEDESQLAQHLGLDARNMKLEHLEDHEAKIAATAQALRAFDPTGHVRSGPPG